MAPDVGQIKRIGIVGAGSMGTMMSLGFSECGLDVSIWDLSGENVDKAHDLAQQSDTLKGRVDHFKDIHEFTRSLDSQPRKIFVFSITHGWPADSVLDKIRDDLKEGDIILDGGNENYRNTERRQKELESRGIKWIGMGVSGGYQSARHGPSMSPGGDKDTIEFVLPLLEKFAAKSAKDGTPCVKYIGPGGAGHYVKMVHNGIENGMLSAICEAWSFLHRSLGLSYDEIGKTFERWDSDGEMRNTYLIQIAAEICQTKEPAPDSADGRYVLDSVLDKVVQDDDNSEGTEFWTVMDMADRHVSAPTIAAGQFFRVASGDRAQRLKVTDKLKLPQPRRADITAEDKDHVVEQLRRAVYASFLCSFCQGLELIARASTDEGWDVNLGTCIQIWRAGCIIQEDHIADMLEPIFLGADQPIMNMKLVDEVAAALRDNYPALKQTALRAIEWDNYAPAICASLEYLKYCGGGMLATQFMEAEMDYFGAHAFDRPGMKGEDPGSTTKGAKHYEWQPA